LLFWPTYEKFLTKSIVPGGWAFQTALKGAGPIFVMDDPFIADNYAMIGGK
jgi:hypothetical protein